MGSFYCCFCCNLRINDCYNCFIRKNKVSQLLYLSYIIQFRFGVIDSFDTAKDSLKSVKRPENDLYKFTEEYKENITLANINNFENYSLALQDGLKEYSSVSGSHIDEARDLEIVRSVGVILFLVYFILVIILTVVGFFLHKENLVMVLALLIFLTIPGIIVFDGYIAKFFFYYGDICTSVNRAIYKGEFPVANKAFGYYVNCLEKETKWNLYIINYQLYEFEHSQYMPENKSRFDNIKAEINNLVNCADVKTVVPEFEELMCQKSIDWLLKIVQLFIWLLVALIALGVAIGRVEVVIWRKKKEIESMLDIMEAVY